MSKIDLPFLINKKFPIGPLLLPPEHFFKQPIWKIVQLGAIDELHRILEAIILVLDQINAVVIRREQNLIFFMGQNAQREQRLRFHTAERKPGLKIQITVFMDLNRESTKEPFDQVCLELNFLLFKHKQQIWDIKT